MRKILTINLLIACLILPACTDHVGTVVTDKAGPEAPINDPDSGVFNPSEPAAGGDDPVAGNTGGSTNAGGTGGGNSGGTGQGSSGSGTQPGGGGSPAGGGGGNPGGEPGGGNSGGQPVPEPGTLLLVGSGLAGIGASLLRRRRRREDGQGTAS
jgi:hypothetical protein